VFWEFWKWIARTEHKSGKKTQSEYMEEIC
jgi:hypothetical protein